MATEERRFAYCDFTKKKEHFWVAKTTGEVATGADTQVDYAWIGGNYFELYQGGANDELAAGQFIPSATGWLVPLDGAGATKDHIEITQGIVTGATTPMKFTVGTDAFYMKVKVEQTTLNKILYLGCGFRKLGAYTVTASMQLAADAIAVWDEFAGIAIVDNAGTLKGLTSVAGSDVATTATASPAVTGTAITLETYVSAAGVVSFKVNGASDVLLAAATAATLTSGQVVIPTVTAIRAVGATASGTELVSYECGLQ